MSPITLPDMMAVADEEDDLKPETADLNDVLERLPLEDDYEWQDGSDPDLWLYRDRTVAILKRYARLSVEAGRLPSLLGREFFRGHVTAYQATTFEDVVIFVHDVERCLEKLDGFSQQLIAKCILLDYSQPDAARLLHVGLRTVERELPDALDRLTQLFLAGEILKNRTERVRPAPKTCQEGRNGEFLVSCCGEGKNNF
jgi:DNA-directed RNA polymerase specialized sigma24 family protein